MSPGERDTVQVVAMKNYEGMRKIMDKIESGLVELDFAELEKRLLAKSKASGRKRGRLPASGHGRREASRATPFDNSLSDEARFLRGYMNAREAGRFAQGLIQAEAGYPVKVHPNATERVAWLRWRTVG